MNRKELIENIFSNDDVKMSKKAINLFLNSMEHIISEGIASEGIVRIKEFGTFKKVLRKSRIVRLPNGDIAETTDKYVVKFIPCKSLKSSLKGTINSNNSEIKIDTTIRNTGVKGKNTDTRYKTENVNKKTPTRSNNRKPKPNTTNKKTGEGALITGTRQQPELVENTFEPKYIYSTIHGEQFHQISEWEYYPNMYIPAKNTEILSAIESANHQIRGVSEGKFREIIEQVTSCIPEIDIQDNMHIPIIGTTQCYDPDIVLSWAKEKIYIDIEIDEKYDIESGTPIHYIGSRDEDRDIYLVEQGWCVLRISEEDVIKYSQELVQTIKNYLYSISYDARLKPIQQQMHKVKRWTYSEAEEATHEHFREKLLGLPIKSYEKPKEDNRPGEVSSFVPTKYKELEEQIKIAKNSKNVIIAVYPNGGEYVFDNNSIKIIKEKSWTLLGKDVIEEKEIQIPFYKIYKIDGRDNIIGKRIFASSDIIQLHKDVTKAINIARLSCNPVKFSYINRQEKESERTVVYLSYWFKIMDDNSLTMKDKLLLVSSWLYENGVDDPISKSSADYFTGYCLKEEEHKTFRTDRITYLIVYDIYKPHPKVTYGTYASNEVWDCLEKGKLEIIEYIYKTIPPFIADLPLNIENKCIYLIMKGELDKAYENIKSFEPNFFVKEASMEWKEIVLNDCEHFIDSDNYADNFREMVSRLKSAWNIA